ncbi:MAG: cell division protein FtsL, partial [Caldisericaceae bacterium]
MRRLGRVSNKLLLFILVIVVFLNSVVFFATLNLKKKVTDLEGEIDILKADNSKLSSTYYNLINPLRIEKLAKEKLKMVEVKKFYV